MKKKIAFVGHDLKFIEKIIQKYKSSDIYEVKIDKWTGHNIHDEAYSKNIIQWADIIFCEWGLGNVVWYQSRKRKDQKLYVRLHRAEMNSNFPCEFDYSKIEKFIVVSAFAFEEFHFKCGIPREKMVVISNSVDIDCYGINKTNHDINYNIGMVGYCPRLKRLDIALDILDKLIKKDNRYKLYLKGKHPQELEWVWKNENEKKYFEEILERIQKKYINNIIFEEWGDTSQFFKKIKYCLSLSDYESFHLAPVEGMASGTIPLVLNSRGGIRGIFPKEVVFETIDDIVNAILSKNNDNLEEMLKKFVKNNYDLNILYKEMEKLTSCENIELYNEKDSICIESKENEMKYYYYDIEYKGSNLVIIPEINWETSGEIQVQCFLIEYDDKGSKLNVNKLEKNNSRIIELMKNTCTIKLAIRKELTGKIRVDNFKLKVYPTLEIANDEIIEKRKCSKKYLILTNVYPSNDDLYRNGFVHSRVKEYHKNGIEVDIYSMRPDGSKIGKYYFDGVEVYNGDKNALTFLLNSKAYEKILIHFVNPQMIEGIKNSKKDHKLIIWIHGFETERWFRRKFNYTEEEIEQNKEKWESEDIKKMEFMKTLYLDPNNKFIFVSKWFKEAVAEKDTECQVKNYEIIPNVVNEEIFNYIPKQKDQRKNILTIRPFASNKYANDLTVKAILELSKEDFFNDLTFTIYGKGKLFEELLKPLRKFNNIKIYEKFLTQDEISKEHKKNGIFMCPTRLDAQGVSMCEAMSSGLVPITIGVTAIPEYVDKESGILGREENYKDLAAGIKRLYLNSDEFLKMSKNTSKKIQSQCGVKKVIKNEIKVIIS